MRMIRIRFPHVPPSVVAWSADRTDVVAAVDVVLSGRFAITENVSLPPVFPIVMAICVFQLVIPIHSSVRMDNVWIYPVVSRIVQVKPAVQMVVADSVDCAVMIDIVPVISAFSNPPVRQIVPVKTVVTMAVVEPVVRVLTQ